MRILWNYTKYEDGVVQAKSVDSDQTAPFLIRVCSVCFSTKNCCVSGLLVKSGCSIF